MPRPTSQTELLTLARQNYEKLVALIDPLPTDAQIQPGIVGEWSIKDVLAHLLAWQQMTVGWYHAGKRGETPVTPSEKYTWQEIPALNQAIYETHRDEPLAQLRGALDRSHEATLTLLATLSDAELFTPKVYGWTKTTTVGAYFISATSSHYDWAWKEIRRGLKAKQPPG